jgi:hypothetical protein
MHQGVILRSCQGLVMRSLLRIAALLLFSSLSPAQDRLQVVSSTPLPKNILTRLGGGLRVGSPQAGGALFGLTPVADANWRMTHEMAVLNADGTSKATIDLDKVPGMGMAFIEDFAPGPDGEIYVAAKKIVVTHSAVDRKGQIYERFHEEDPQLWILRFSDTGRCGHEPDRSRVCIRASCGVSIGIIPGRRLSFQATLPGQQVHSKLIPYAAIFSRDVKLVREVTIPDEVLLPEPRTYGFVKQPEPMLGGDGNMYVVVVPSEKPALTVVHPDGAVSGTVALRIPTGYLLGEPRLAGERLIAQVDEIKLQNGVREFVELDVHTGDLMYVHLLPEAFLRLSCQTRSRGIEVYDLFSGLDTLMAGAEKERKLH